MKTILIIGLLILIIWLLRAIRKVQQIEFPDLDDVNYTETRKANLTLAYRHLEDASMRIGKTIQALAGGNSIYDNNAVGTPDNK